MSCEAEWKAQVDDEGRLILPAEIVRRFGLRPGAKVSIDEGATYLRLYQPTTHLAKVYIEPTNGCNLKCLTCIRNIWEEPTGQMSSQTFARILQGLRSLPSPPIVIFGGFGEPLTHPDIAEMVAQVKTLGGSVELVTNGTMLTQEISERFIKAHLDVLWVSIDGAKPESYADVRLGAALPQVLANLAAFRDTRMRAWLLKPEIGVVFVAMKRNVKDLPSLLQIGSRLDVTRFLVTNVLPYTEELKGEVLYSEAVLDIVYQPRLKLPHLDLPKLDVGQVGWKPLYEALRSNGQTVSMGGAMVGEASDRCPFIERGATAISWKGDLSPCLPLMHRFVSFLDDRRRVSNSQIVGNVNDSSLTDLWNGPEYVAFRERVGSFSFSHCVFCAGCDLSLANEQDCRGNLFPTCGGCLWAQGVIRCP
jgi:MoaA/NifB/PqqE/SkfB family radical SAM enzyme